MTLAEFRVILSSQSEDNLILLTFIPYGKISICHADFLLAPSKLLVPAVNINMYNKTIRTMLALL